MKLIQPVVEENIKPHCGKTVIVVLHDGNPITGVLTKVEAGKLYLNGESGTAKTAKKTKKLSGKKGSRPKARLSAFPAGTGPLPPLPPGPALVLDLPLVALLFVMT